MHVFVIGFNKCGTLSIHDRLTALGFHAAHHERGEIAQRMKGNLLEGAHVLEGLEDYDAFSDITYLSETEHIEANCYFREFMEMVPDSMFILNTRRREHWVKSRLDHPDFARRFMAVYGYGNESDMVTHWREEWDRHHAEVLAEIPMSRLLVLNIDTDPMTRIDAFLNRTAPAPPAHMGFTPSLAYTFLENTIPVRIREQLPLNWRREVKYLLRKRR